MRRTLLINQTAQLTSFKMNKTLGDSPDVMHIGREWIKSMYFSKLGFNPAIQYKGDKGWKY